MSQMRLVNLRVPKELKNSIERVSMKEYLSEGEFIRSSIIKLLLRFGILPQSNLIEMLRNESRERMKTKKEKFDKDKEIMSLKKIREKIYLEKHKSSS